VYIATEYITTGDISKTFFNDYRWNESDTRVVIEQLLHGLVVMNKEGIIHCDLKPEVCALPGLDYHGLNLIVTRKYSSAFRRMGPRFSA